MTDRRYKETLTSILGFACKYTSTREEGDGRRVVSDVIDHLVAQEGVKEALNKLVSNETLIEYVSTMKSPDWVQLYLKLQARIPDHQWQNILNLTQFGPSKVRSIFFL